MEGSGWKNSLRTHLSTCQTPEFNSLISEWSSNGMLLRTWWKAIYSHGRWGNAWCTNNLILWLFAKVHCTITHSGNQDLFSHPRLQLEPQAELDPEIPTLPCRWWASERNIQPSHASHKVNFLQWYLRKSLQDNKIIIFVIIGKWAAHLDTILW